MTTFACEDSLTSSVTLELNGARLGHNVASPDTFHVLLLCESFIWSFVQLISLLRRQNGSERSGQ